MRITMVGFLSNVKRSDLEKKVKASDIVDDIDMEDLDKVDCMKDITIVFKEPIDARFIGKTLTELLSGIEKTVAAEDE